MGRACVESFAAEGRQIFAAGRRPEPLARLRADLGERVVPLALDVGDGPAVRAAFAGLPPVEVLVANAGLCATAALDAPEAEDVWRAVLRTNLDGVFHCLRAALPHLVDGGRVIVISSGLGKLGRAGYGAYCAAKHGVLGLVRSAALELAPRGITVNAICPGWVDTPMAQADLGRASERSGLPVGALRAEARAGIPLGRFVEPAEVAALVAFLSGPQAAMITGEAWNLSGGEFTT
ncbi:MAG: SDR family NAD(P)-dependent oxidoreductase [bacterium]